MGVWGSEVHSPSKTVNSLTDAVKLLSPKAKQQMFAAASHGLIKRGTWDGCAFNAAGKNLFQEHVKDGLYDSQAGSVSDFGIAAQIFEMPMTDVRSFIHCWDNLPGEDEEVTAQLREAIEKVGLFTEPGEFRVKTFVKRIFTSEEEKMKQEFDKVVADLNFTDHSADSYEAEVSQVGNLLSAKA